MSWKNRAIPVNAPAESSGGSWKDRAVPVQEAPDSGVPGIGKLESFLRGGRQGLSLGYGDEIKGAINALFGEDSYSWARDKERAKNASAREANPWTYGTGEFGGAVLPSAAAMVATGGGAAPAVGGALAKGALKTIAPTTIKGMAALGGIDASGRSEEDLTKGEIIPFLQDVGVGAAFGTGAGVLGKGVSKLAGGLRAKKLADVAQTQGARAMGNTKRFLGDPIKRAKAKADAQLLLDAKTPEGKDIIGWFSGADDIAQNVDALKKQTGQAIGDYLDTLDMRGKFFDVKKAIADLNAMRPMSETGRVLNKGAYADINRTIDNAINTVKAHGSKELSFQTANEVKGVIQDLANWNSNKNATILDKKIAGTFRGSVDKALEEVSTMPRTQAAFEGFKRNKSLYGAASRGEDSIANRASSEMGNNIVGLGDMVLAAPTMAAHGAGVAGAMVGAKRVADRFGAQVTAKTFNKAAKISANTLEPMIKANPQFFGKFLPILQQSAARGSEELAVVHYTLSQSDPDYQALMSGQVP